MINMAKKTERIFTNAANIRQLVYINNQKRPGKVLFRYFDREGNLEEITYGAFFEKVEKIIASIKEKNLVGKRIAIIGENCPEWIEFFCAAIAAGCVVIPFDKELLVEEIKGFIELGKVDAIVFSPRFSKKYAEFKEAGALDILEYIIPASTAEIEDDGDKRVVSLDDFIKDATPEIITPSEIMRARPRGDMSIMLFTSGTTGSSKCVMLSERNIMACAKSACEAVDFSENDVTMSVLPIHHTYELTITICEMLYGMTSCINDNLKHVLKNLKLFKPTSMVLVPLFVSTFNKKIWDEVKKKGKERQFRLGMTAANTLKLVGIDMRRKLFSDVLDAFGGNLEKLICGGAAMDPELMKMFDTLGIDLCEGYGITECSPLISVNPYYRKKYGSVGPAVSCCEVKIDAESTDEEGRMVGEILAKGENVMVGYFDNLEANMQVFTDDGWFRTGDVGYMDSDGYLYITGRKKTVIVLSNGKNVFPEEIEEYLDKIDSIAESVVVGRQKDNGETEVTAVVYPNFDMYPVGIDIGIIAEDIKKKVTELNRHLPTFKQIRNIDVRKTEFEKTTSRKIKRFLVK